MKEKDTLEIKNTLEGLGYNFGQIAAIESPEEAIDELIARIGTIFECDRVYIFERNREDNYDCRNEWVKEEHMVKQHLLQNLPKQSVHFYYNYFMTKGCLSVKNIEHLKQEDSQLYKILKPQALSSLLVGQLVYDDKDRGFVGIDNPNPEKFEELQSVFGAINYYISIQMHRQEMMGHMDQDNNLVTSSDSLHQQSLYERFSAITPEVPLAVIYWEVSMQREEQAKDKTVLKRMIEYAEYVMSSIFGARNVYDLGNNEFVIVYEENDEMDIYNISHYIDIVGTTLGNMNIYISMGVVTTEKYEDNFFELLNSANVRMLKKKKEYRDMYMEKYHMQYPATTFLDFVEIQPSKDYYHVLYNESYTYNNTTGHLSEAFPHMLTYIEEEDKERFKEFWNKMTRDELYGKEPIVENFKARKQEHEIINLEVTIARYTGTKGNPVYMCYTR